MAVATASATATGTLVASSRAKVLGVYWRAGATAGTIVLRDGGAGGTVRLTLNTPAAVSAGFLPIFGGGLVFNTDVHATLTTADGVTIVYDTAA